MSVTTGQASVSDLWSEYILRKFVPELRKNLILADYAKPAQLPKNAGAYIARWNRFKQFDTTTTALAELSASDGEITEVTVTAVTGAMAPYGQWMKVSDLAEETELETAMDEYSKAFGQAGAESIDAQIRNAGFETTTFLHAGDVDTQGVTLVAGDQLTLQDFPVIAGAFRVNNAMGFQSLGGDYALAVPPEVEVDLITDVTTDRLAWGDVMKHTSPGFEKLVDNHRMIGRYAGVSALRTTNLGATVSEDVDAYRCLALADCGVGWAGLGKNPSDRAQIKIKRPGPNDTSQPLDMYMTIGWKVTMVAKLLDLRRVMTVYSAVAAS